MELIEWVKFRKGHKYIDAMAYSDNKLLVRHNDGSLEMIPCTESIYNQLIYYLADCGSIWNEVDN